MFERISFLYQFFTRLWNESCCSSTSVFHVCRAGYLSSPCKILSVFPSQSLKRRLTSSLPAFDAASCRSATPAIGAGRGRNSGNDAEGATSGGALSERKSERSAYGEASGSSFSAKGCAEQYTVRQGQPMWDSGALFRCFIVFVYSKKDRLCLEFGVVW